MLYYSLETLSPHHRRAGRQARRIDKTRTFPRRRFPSSLELRCALHVQGFPLAVLDTLGGKVTVVRRKPCRSIDERLRRRVIMRGLLETFGSKLRVPLFLDTLFSTVNAPPRWLIEIGVGPETAEELRRKIRGGGEDVFVLVNPGEGLRTRERFARTT